jgi:hypothetical protein
MTMEILNFNIKGSRSPASFCFGISLLLVSLLFAGCSQTPPDTSGIHRRNMAFLETRLKKSITRLKLRTEEQRHGKMYLGLSGDLDSLRKGYFRSLDEIDEGKGSREDVDRVTKDFIKKSGLFFDSIIQSAKPKMLLAEDTTGLRIVFDSVLYSQIRGTKDAIQCYKEDCLQQIVEASEVFEGAFGIMSDWVVTMYDYGFRLQISQRGDTTRVDHKFVHPYLGRELVRTEFLTIEDSLEKNVAVNILENRSGNTEISLRLKGLRPGKYFLKHKLFFYREEGSRYDMEKKVPFYIR